MRAIQYPRNFKPGRIPRSCNPSHLLRWELFLPQFKVLQCLQSATWLRQHVERIPFSIYHRYSSHNWLHTHYTWPTSAKICWWRFPPSQEITRTFVYMPFPGLCGNRQSRRGRCRCWDPQSNCHRGCWWCQCNSCRYCWRSNYGCGCGFEPPAELPMNRLIKHLLSPYSLLCRGVSSVTRTTHNSPITLSESGSRE